MLRRSPRRDGICVYMVDSRPLRPFDGVEAMLLAKFSTLTYAVNWLYGAEMGYDVRFVMPSLHHYENGTANLFLTDLVTNNVYRITDMPADTKALFPHFRSDGWIYFLASGAQDSQPDCQQAQPTCAFS